MNRKATVVVVDSDAPFRKAFRQHLAEIASFELIGEAENLTAGQELIAKTRPDMVILELPSKPAEALAKAERWRSEFPGILIYGTSSSRNPESILAAMRAGVSEYLGKPLEAKELHAALDRAVRFLETTASHADHSGKVIALFSKKGGLGVTTLAVNLAAGLGMKGENQTVLVDMDFDLGDVASFLDLKPQFNMGDVLDKHGRVDPGQLQSCLIPHASGVFYLGTRDSIGAVDPPSPAQLRDTLVHLKETFKHVILDLPHMFDSHTYEAFEVADKILLLSVCDLSAIRATKHALSIFRSLGYSGDKVQLVLNRVSKKNPITPKQFEETIEHSISWQIPNDYPSVIESINIGEPLVLSKGKSDVARTVLQMAEQFAGFGNGSGPAVAGTRAPLARRTFGRN